MKTGSNPPTLTAPAENDVDKNDVVERAYRGKENTTGTEVKATNKIKEEWKEKKINELNQTRPNLDKDPETEVKENQRNSGKNAEENLEQLWQYQLRSIIEF